MAKVAVLSIFVYLCDQTTNSICIWRALSDARDSPLRMTMGKRHVFERAVQELNDVLHKTRRLDHRIRAVRAASALGPHAAPLVPELMKLLKLKPCALRERAAEALGEIGPAADAAVSLLARVMLQGTHREADHARTIAARSLGKIGSGDAVGPLVDALQWRDEQGPALSAISALQRLGARAAAAAPVLKRLASDGRYPFRDNAALACEYIEKASAVSSIRKLKQGPKRGTN